MTANEPTIHNTLRLRRLGIETHQEAVVYMRDDCPVCRSEGFEAQSRVQVTVGERAIIATLYVVSTDLAVPCLLAPGGATPHEVLAARAGEALLPT